MSSCNGQFRVIIILTQGLATSLSNDPLTPQSGFLEIYGPEMNFVFLNPCHVEVHERDRLFEINLGTFFQDWVNSWRNHLSMACQII